MKFVAMKRLALSILAVTVVAVLPAHADEWTKTYNLSGKPDLRIETSDANIRVTAWDQNRIEAKVITNRYKIGEGGIRVDEHQNGDSIEIDVRYPHHNFNVEWGQHRVDIIIQMPREGRVNLRTGDGKIDIAGLKGEMDLHSGDGSENLEAVDGKLHASTGDGHITAHGGLTNSNSRPAMDTWKCARLRGLRWPRAGGSKPATATFRSKSQANSRPTLACTPATATSISTCPSRPRARFARMKSTVSSTAAAVR